jgi:hypothetical protein
MLIQEYTVHHVACSGRKGSFLVAFFAPMLHRAVNGQPYREVL